jgi:hypothetical protein
MADALARGKFQMLAEALQGRQPVQSGSIRLTAARSVLAVVIGKRTNAGTDKRAKLRPQPFRGGPPAASIAAGLQCQGVTRSAGSKIDARAGRRSVAIIPRSPAHQFAPQRIARSPCCRISSSVRSGASLLPAVGMQPLERLQRAGVTIRWQSAPASASSAAPASAGSW